MLHDSQTDLVFLPKALPHLIPPLNSADDQENSKQPSKDLPF